MDTNENYLQPKTRKSKASNVIPNENFGLEHTISSIETIQNIWLWTLRYSISQHTAVFS